MSPLTVSLFQFHCMHFCEARFRTFYVALNANEKLAIIFSKAALLVKISFLDCQSRTIATFFTYVIAAAVRSGETLAFDSHEVTIGYRFFVCVIVL